MTKLISRVATCIAILGLAGPAIAASTTAAHVTTPPAKSAPVQHKAQPRIAQADAKAVPPKAKKAPKAAAVKTAKPAKAATPAAAPAQAHAPATPAAK